jgi:L-lactate dehydrogenase complex protein LldF
MNTSPSQIKKLVRAALADKGLQQAVAAATEKALTARGISVKQIPFWETLRERNRETKRKVILNLGHYLREFAANCKKHGIGLHWAVDAAEALSIIAGLAKRNNVHRVVKSKSLTTEEIKLNSYLEREEIEVVETDLGEYIIQLKEESPSHLIIPALHLNKQEIGRLFARKLGCSYTEDPVELLQIARAKLREKFLAADMGITGANFALADSGQICVVENEANAHLTLTLPKIHVALLGIEKILPGRHELADFLKALAPSATGQKSSTFVNILGGPLWDQYGEGPGQMHVILLDNGRSNILADPDFRDILACIRCGACLNICPVYRQIGGHAYGWTYMGPIGAVLAPLFLGFKEGRLSPGLCTLCRACYHNCPVKIDLPGLILKLRERNVARGLSGMFEKTGFGIWGFVAQNPTLNRLMVTLLRQVQKLVPAGRSFPVPGYTRERRFARFSPKSFQQIYNDFNDQNPQAGNQ